MPDTVRVFALMEALTVTGPAKNLIEFAQRARAPKDDLPPIEITVGAYVRDPSKPNQFLNALEAAKIPSRVIREKHAGDLSALTQIKSIVDETAPDVIQSHNFKSHFFVWLSGRWKRIPWVGFHHGYTAPAFRTRLYNQFDRLSLPASRRVVTVCRPFSLELQRFGISAERISVVHNAVAEPALPKPAQLEEFQGRYGIRDGVPVIIAVGRLSREKGHRDLVEAAELVHARSPSMSFRLLIAGEGPERSSLESQIHRSGLSGIVTLCGYQADLRPLYRVASLFVLPSYSEGSPNVLLEAMASGVPAVATSVGGVPEIAVDGETALLVEPGNPAVLAERIERLLADHRLAGDLAAQAKGHVLANFSTEAHLRALRGIYQAVLAV